MTSPSRFLASLFGPLALSTAGCASVPAPPPPSAAAASPTGPALWKVADSDTTIFLFGTVHALPEGLDWYKGALAQAFATAEVLVTEVEAGKLTAPETQRMFIARGTLPEGQTLRGLLDDKQRATFENALTKLEMPVAALDRLEPWFAAMTLTALPLLKAGYKMDQGVEMALEGKATPALRREALETVESQLVMFDGMPMPTQTKYLTSVAEQIESVPTSMNDMVNAWKIGDAARLAELMNAQIDDQAVAERLLYARNREWAKWVEKRLETPGTVFVAVGAGHLAGSNSVQDYLTRDGIAVTREQ